MMHGGVEEWLKDFPYRARVPLPHNPVTQKAASIESGGYRIFGFKSESRRDRFVSRNSNIGAEEL